MRAAIICFTAHGADTALRIREALEERETVKDGNVLKAGTASVRIWCAKSDFTGSADSGHVPCAKADHAPCEETDHPQHTCDGAPSDDLDIAPLQVPLRRWTQEAFAEFDALVFVGATGIAVRSIAPFLKSKTSDPAVLCVDELGKFVIPLVSGHIGGANELAARLAGALGAVAVITTATDLNGRFAVDVFAKKNQLWISDMKLAKQISADILDGKKIGFASDFPLDGEIPEELEMRDFGERDTQERDIQERDTRERDIQERNALEGTVRTWDAPARGVCVTLDETKRPFEQTLTLIPRIVSIGVGCRKDTASVLIEEKICAALRACGVSIHSVERLASIDLKAREPGLRAFARKYGIEFVTYTAQELKDVPGEFLESAFVESVTGVSNVCERSAVLASGGQKGGRQETGQNNIQIGGCGCDAGTADGGDLPTCGGKLIQKKTAGDGVTVALAVRDWGVEFG